MTQDNQQGWHTIDVDPDVFSFLQKQARPFLDSPNDVLRKMLFHGNPPVQEKLLQILESKPTQLKRGIEKTNSLEFVQLVLQRHFGGNFRTVGRYQMMFESTEQLVYFENYNKVTDDLWYRISQEPWQKLSTSSKKAWLCLTYPPGKIAYIIPIKDINDKVRQFHWSRPNLEINIYPLSPAYKTHWHQFEWDIQAYKHEFK